MAAPSDNRQNQLKEDLCEFIRTELCEGLTDVRPDSSFEKLGIDSVYLMEIVLYLERTTQCKVRADMLDPRALETVGTLVDAVFKDF